MSAYSVTSVVIMAKYPVAGRVKTRLGADIGTFRSCQLHRIFLQKLIRNFQNDKRFELILATSPDTKQHDKAWHKGLPSKSAIISAGQGTGDLGRRMWRQMQTRRAQPMIILGADCPHLTKSMINKAHGLIKQNDFTLGPAKDGGYWLFARRAGLNLTGRIKITPLDGVIWSSASTLAMTVAHLHKAGFNTSTDLPKLNDIDNGKDYAEWLKRGL